jgi:ABC-type nitrate/sulfonate/bicarbonate transport system substrate-binding protein
MQKAKSLIASRLRSIGIVLGITLSIALPPIVLPLGPVHAAETEQTLFRVGESAPANTYLAIWMAHGAGFYAAQGLDFEPVSMAGGSRAAAELQAGNIQLMHVGMSTVVRANAAGSDLRIIGSLSNVIRFTFFTAPGIETAADLRGGLVGISSTGSESDATTTLALERLGLSRQDITMVEIGRDRLPTLRNGEISATMLGEPDRTQAFAGGLNPIIDLYADRISWLFSGLVVDAVYLDTHRDTLKRFLRATIEGNYLAIGDPVRAKEVLTTALELTDKNVIDASYQNFKNETPENVQIDPEGAQNVLNAVGTLQSDSEIGDYIDMSILNELEAEGFFDAMQAKYGAP